MIKLQTHRRPIPGGVKIAIVAVAFITLALFLYNQLLTVPDTKLLSNIVDKVSDQDLLTHAQIETHQRKSILQTFANDKFRILLHGNKVTINAKNVARIALLEELANKMDFTLLVNSNRQQLEQIISMTSDSQELYRVLDTLLEGINYFIEREYNSDISRHQIVSLHIGTRSEEMLNMALQTTLITSSFPPGPSPEIEQGELPIPGNETTNVDELNNKLELFEYLTLEDKLYTVNQLSPIGNQLQVLIESLLQETDPELRIAAAKRLEKAPGYAGMNALVKVLQDPDPEVAMQAIDSLSRMDDASLLPILRAERNSQPDEKLRLKLDETIKLLEAKYRFF